jgi:hypothetical protein
MSATAIPLALPTVSPYGAGPGAGLAEVAADATNGNSFPNDGHTYLAVRNPDSSTHTLVFPGGHTWTLPKEATVVLGPWPVLQQFGQSVTVTASSANVKLLPYSVDLTASARR